MNKERESGSRAWDLSHTGLRGGGEPVAVWESSELNPFGCCLEEAWRESIRS